MSLSHTIIFTMNGIQLFENIKNASCFQDLLQNIHGNTISETQSKQGNLFEKMWDLIIKFGFCPSLSNDIFTHYEGNMNNCNLKKVENLELYLQHMSIFSKGQGGSSDITLQDKKTGKWIFISSKYYLDDSKKHIDNYDVEKIMANIKQYHYKYKDYNIYLLVNNKQKVFNLIKNSQSTNNYIKQNIHMIFDLNDLEFLFQTFKKSIQNVQIHDLNRLFNNTKIPLTLRFHQDLITHKMLNLIDQQHKNILLGAKPRSGKTYCVGGILIKYYKKYNSLNSLIITPAPTETITQFTNDLFHKFRDFNEINIIEINKGSDVKKIKLQSNNIIIVSKQLLDDYVLQKTITQIKDLNLNIIVFDENHFHGTTQMSKNIFDSYSSPNTVKLYLTATFMKPLNEWNIPPSCQLYWDIEDEQLCKKRNISELIKKHGEDVSLFVNSNSPASENSSSSTGESLNNKDRVLSVYDKMPDLCIMTNMMDMERYELIKQKIKDTSYGFSNSTLLSITEDGNNFIFTEEVDDILKYISGKGKIDEEENPIRDTHSIFERIKQVSNMKNSRTKLNNGDFSTIIWFVPFGKHMLIDRVSVCLKNRMLKNRVFSRYEIMIVNSKKDFKLKDVKEEIKNREQQAKQNDKLGLILLAGNQLSLGISLELVDIVILLNDIKSSDKIIQMMYRSMTETVHNEHTVSINGGDKKIGFVVDLNISRVVNTMLNCKIHKTNFTNEQKIKYLIDNNLINIDIDLFQCKENKTKIVENLINIWKSNPNNIKHILKQIEENVIDIDPIDQTQINNYFTSNQSSKKTIKIQFNEENLQPLNSGKLITKEQKKSSSEEEEEIEYIKSISLTKDILPFIIPLSCILTLQYNCNDFNEILNIIVTNPKLLEIFNNQIYNWWKIENTNFIINLVKKYVINNYSINTISNEFKSSLSELANNPKEFLELINSVLIPKQTEKQENGEVFTPICVIDEMLNNLNNFYKKETGKYIFTDPHFKWGDIHGCGMGNFSIALYLRLMDGLAEQIPNEHYRKQHILENMIYMAEMNKKNAFICNLIFNYTNTFKLNLYEGDVMNLNIKSTWNIDHFDVTFGNPPYNKGGIRSHTGKHLGDKNETIWTKFIQKSVEWLKPEGYSLTITPLSWLKQSHSLHKVFLEKHILYLNLWDNSQSKNILNVDIPISFVVLKNTVNNLHAPTEINSILKRKKLTFNSIQYLSPDNSVPLAFHSIFNKLNQFIQINNLVLEYKTKTIKTIDPQIKMPDEFSIDDKWAVDTYTIKNGIMVKKMIEIHPDTNKRKLIILNKSSFKGSFIDEGRLGLTGNHKFYILGEQLELIQKLLNFKIIDIVSQYTKYGQDFLDNEAFKFIPDIRKLPPSSTLLSDEGLFNTYNITEESFYDLIQLTTEEINQINDYPSYYAS